jgi:hypothetical protein
MKERIAAACRLFVIYGIPFLAISLAEKLPSMQGYDASVIFGGIAWMFGFNFLLNGKTPNDSNG